MLCWVDAKYDVVDKVEPARGPIPGVLTAVDAGLRGSVSSVRVRRHDARMMQYALADTGSCVDVYST